MPRVSDGSLRGARTRPKRQVVIRSSACSPCQRGGLKGSAQHFLDSTVEEVAVGHGDYERLTPEAVDQVWLRLRVGQAAKPTARELGLCTGTVRAYLLRCGGIRPEPRRRYRTDASR
jgi:hypothetical protein